jgi:hypothetical protein
LTVSSHQHQSTVVKEQKLFAAHLPTEKVGFGRTDRTNSLKPNAYSGVFQPYLASDI